MLRSFRLTCVLAGRFGWLRRSGGFSTTFGRSRRRSVASTRSRRVGRDGARGLRGLTYVSAWFRDHPRHVLPRCSRTATTAYFAVLVWANHLVARLRRRVLFVFVMAVADVQSSAPVRAAGARALDLVRVRRCVVVTARSESRRPRCFCSSVGVTDRPRLRRPSWRGWRSHEALRNSRERLAAAEALAGTGAGTHDLRTGRSLWSDGLYQLLGHRGAARRRPATVIDDVRPPATTSGRCRDARHVAASRAARSAEFRFRIVRPDGEMRSLRSVVHLPRDACGRPARFGAPSWT